jgi:thymidine kinase
MDNHNEEKNFGSIKVYVGPMFSRKTTEVLNEVERAMIGEMNVGLFKPISDTRYSVDEVATHSNIRLKCQPVEDADDLLKKVTESPHFLDMVAIDEVQFLRGKVSEACAQFRDEGRRVVAGGLDMNFLRRPFGSIGDLMAIADEVIRLKAVCTPGDQKCGKPASFSWRLTKDQAELKLGGKGDYAAVCGSCFLRLQESKKSKE